MRLSNPRIRAPRPEPAQVQDEARERGPAPTFNGLRSIDWRGWLLVAWVTWFGVLYAQMMLAARASTFMAIVHRVLQRLSLGA